MAQTKTEKGVTGNHKEKTKQRKQAEAEIIGAPDQIQEGIILKKCYWDDVGVKFKDALTVDRERISSEFPTSVCENVHEFQAFNREKA